MANGHHVAISVTNGLDDTFIARVYRDKGPLSELQHKLYCSPLCTTPTRALQYAKEFCSNKRYAIDQTLDTCVAEDASATTPDTTQESTALQTTQPTQILTTATIRDYTSMTSSVELRPGLGYVESLGGTHAQVSHVLRQKIAMAHAKTYDPAMTNEHYYWTGSFHVATPDARQ